MPAIVKRKYLFLYLAIACFAGMVAIFIVDGYLGIYDTVYVTAREYTQKIEADYWSRQSSAYYPTPEYGDGSVYCCIYTNAGDNIIFRYEIANHQFSTYATTVESSVWQQEEIIIDLASEDVEIDSFNTVSVEWKLSSEALENAGFDWVSGQNQYTVRINHGEVERRIIVEFYYNEDLIEPKPSLVR
ncbi:hypothetical protein ACFLUH_03145 [Chloroflexota bacterium]